MSQPLFKKSKLAAAIACSIMLTGCLIEGDNAAGSITVTEDAKRLDVNEIATPMATVVGLVQDTNGNPISGARVSLAGKTVIADVNGTYVFENIAVTGFSNGAGTTGADLSVTIVPPLAGDGSIKYVSATVTVNPQAQVIVSAAGDITGNETSSTDNALLSVIIADGLTISAGAAVLPALGANVEGVLRNKDTGLIIPNVAVSLEFKEGGTNANTSQEQSQNSLTTTYGVSRFLATTDDTGKFMFSNLPEDSDYQLNVAGYGSVTSIENSAGANNDVTTDNEGVLLNMGDVLVTFIEIADAISPIIDSITGSISTGSVAKLKEGLDGTQGIVINFTEPMATTIDANSVFIVDTTDNIIISVSTVTLSEDGVALTITTASAVPAGNTFQIYIAKHDVTDTSANLLANNGTVTWDSVTASAGDLEAIKLELQTYTAPITTSTTVTITRIDEEGVAADADFDVMRAANAAFVDVNVDGATTIEQLNADSASARLKALNNQTVADSGLGQLATDVVTDKVRVSFNVTQAGEYRLTLVDSNGDDATISASDLSADVTSTGNGSNELTLTLDTGFTDTTVEMILSGVDINAILTVTPYTDFATPINAAAGTLGLTDRVAATTVLQYSYGYGNATSGTTDKVYGDGGELSGAGDQVVGTPKLAVTPLLLVPQASNDPVPLDQSTIWDALVASNEMHANNDSKVNFTSLTAGFEGYDATAMAAYTPGARTLGVAFSEDVSVTGTPAFVGTAILSAYTAAADITVNDQNAGQANGEADLVRFTVNNPLTLANDNGAVIDFTNVIQDSAGNVSTAAYNAKVVIEDKMPALATTAIYNGDSIILTFADAVSIEVGDTLTLDGSAANHIVTVNQVNEDANTGVTTVTINLNTDTNSTSNSLLTRVATPINWDNVFDRGTFDHDSNVATDERRHSVVTYDDVQDANGNKWSDYAGDFNLPAIAIRNDVDDLAVISESATAGYAVGSAVITYKIVSSHAIDMQATFAGVAAGAQTLTANQVAAVWAVTGQTVDVTDPTNTGAVLSADNKTLTVTIALDAAMVSNDELTIQAVSINSAWDSSTAAIALTVDPAPLP
jgi:hypothetical protein